MGGTKQTILTSTTLCFIQTVGCAFGGMGCGGFGGGGFGEMGWGGFGPTDLRLCGVRGLGGGVYMSMIHGVVFPNPMNLGVHVV
jgi:hypothetical protein